MLYVCIFLFYIPCDSPFLFSIFGHLPPFSSPCSLFLSHPLRLVPCSSLFLYSLFLVLASSSVFFPVSTIFLSPHSSPQRSCFFPRPSPHSLLHVTGSFHLPCSRVPPFLYAVSRRSLKPGSKSHEILSTSRTQPSLSDSPKL